MTLIIIRGESIDKKSIALFVLGLIHTNALHQGFSNCGTGTTGGLFLVASLFKARSVANLVLGLEFDIWTTSMFWFRHSLALV